MTNNIYTKIISQCADKAPLSSHILDEECCSKIWQATIPEDKEFFQHYIGLQLTRGDKFACYIHKCILPENHISIGTIATNPYLKTEFENIHNARQLNSIEDSLCELNAKKINDTYHTALKAISYLESHPDILCMGKSVLSTDTLEGV